MSKVLTCVLIVLMLGSVSSAGQECLTDDDEAAIEQLLRTYLRYTKECSFKKMALLIAPEEIEGLKELMAEGAEIAEDSGSFDQVQALFGDSVKSAMDIRRMDNAAFFEQFMSVMLLAVPDFKNVLGGMEGAYLGSVCESNDRAYAVTKVRMNLMGETVEGTDVIPLHRTSDGTWKVGLKQDMRALARALAGT